MRLTLRALLQRLADWPEAEMVEAEALFAQELTNARDVYLKLKDSEAWASLSAAAAKAQGLDFQPGRYGYLGPFQIHSLAHVAELIAIRDAGDYQAGLAAFYEGEG